jgi:hypothetical protein
LKKEEAFMEEKRMKVPAGKSSTRNLNTGIKNTHKNSLSATDICRIIKACQTSGVAEVTLDGLHLVFNSRRNESAEVPGPATDHTTLPIVEDIFGERDQAKLMDDNSLLEAEEAQLLIDDPLAFERSQIDRHIERARLHNGRVENR